MKSPRKVHSDAHIYHKDVYELKVMSIVLTGIVGVICTIMIPLVIVGFVVAGS